MAVARTRKARTKAHPEPRPESRPKLRSHADAGAAENSIPIDARVASILRKLKAKSSEAKRAGLARYAIPTERALGVSMRDIQALGKSVGRDRALADALWETGVYEARLLAAYVGDPATIDAARMDRWCRDFDNWAVCDTLCFALFDRSPLAWKKAETWTKRRGEFQRRAAFALLAGLALHDKRSEDARFLRGLEWIERAAEDDRNFVKKAVNWALRSIGGRNPALHRASAALAKRLSASANPTARWIGKDAYAQLMRPMVLARVEKRAHASKSRVSAGTGAKKTR